MSSSKSPLNFDGQKFYIGLDVHKKNWTVTIRSLGIELTTFSMNPSPQELLRYLQQHYPHGHYDSVYEAGFCGFWIHRELETLGLHNRVINPADVPTTGKEKSRKNDKIDSRKLARELENGSLTAIYVPNDFHLQLRSFCRLRYRVSQNQTRVKNRLKGFLAFYGYSLPRRDEMSHWSGQFIQWLRALEIAYGPGQEYLNLCLDELESHRRRLTIILRSLRYYCRNFNLQEQVDYLKSVKGIGFVTAITLYTEIIDMHRFRTLDELASFVGFVPSVYASGDQETTLGLTFRRNRYLRHLLVEAAWIAVRKDPALTQTFSRLLRRMSKERAIIRIAKKLLNRVRHVWLKQTTYVVGVVE